MTKVSLGVFVYANTGTTVCLSVLTQYSGESHLCWAYSSSTMIRRSIIYFFMKHKDDAELNLTIEKKSEIVEFVKSNKFHFILRNPILMNPIPKRLKKGETQEQRALHESLPLQTFLDRVS